VVCSGTGSAGVSVAYSIYPHCPSCGREFSAQGRKAMARLGNPWQAVPKHYVSERVPA
jgi:hypothetical protein